jgi:hypothetical protein
MSVEMKNEKLILLIIRTLVEEWGPDRVIISVPRRWSEHVPAGYLGSVRLAFEEDRDHITVRAGGTISRTFRLEMAN